MIRLAIVDDSRRYSLTLYESIGTTIGKWSQAHPHRARLQRRDPRLSERHPRPRAGLGLLSDRPGLIPYRWIQSVFPHGPATPGNEPS